MTIFKANRKFPNPITVTDDTRSHTLALQQIIEALNVGQRRTKEINSSYVRVHELVDVGLIEVVGNQLKLTNAGSAAVAAGASALADLTDVDLTGLADGDTLVWDSGTSKWVPAAPGGAFNATDLYDQTLSNLGDVGIYMPSDNDVLTYDSSTGLWGAARPTANTWVDPAEVGLIYETHFGNSTYVGWQSFTQNGSSVSDTSTILGGYPGIVRVQSATNVGDGSAVYSLNNSLFSTGETGTPPSTGYLVTEWLVRCNDVVTANVSAFRIGLLQFSGTANYIVVEGKNGGWYVQTSNSGGSTSQTNLSVTPGDNTWFRLRIEYSTTFVRVYIDDVLAATHTTTLPSAAMAPGIHATNGSIAISPAIIIDVDWFRWYYVVGGDLNRGAAASYPEQIVYKAADTARTTTTTLADDPDLIVPLAAGCVYEFEVQGFLVAQSASGASWNMNFSGTTTWTKWTGTQVHNNSGSWGVLSTVFYAAANNAIPAANNMGWSNGFGPFASSFDCKGTIAVGATGGNLSLRWAQRASSATATTLEKGSFLRAKRIA